MMAAAVPRTMTEVVDAHHTKEVEVVAVDAIRKLVVVDEDVVQVDEQIGISKVMQAAPEYSQTSLVLHHQLNPNRVYLPHRVAPGVSGPLHLYSSDRHGRINSSSSQ